MYIPEDFANVNFRFSLTDDPELMITSVGLHVGDSPVDAQAELISDAWADAWLPALGTAYTYHGVLVEVGHGEDPPTTFEFDPLSVGGSSDARLPQNCALLIRKVTSLGGRANKGRFFMPGLLPEGFVSPVGMISNTIMGDLQSRASDFYDNLVASGGLVEFEPVVLHTDPVAIPTPIASFSVQQLIATQRRRMRP